MFKTLASLKISRAFLFKYSMCVGSGIEFSPLCLWDIVSLGEAQLHGNNSVFLPKAGPPALGACVGPWSDWGNGQWRWGGKSDTRQSEMPWKPAPPVFSQPFAIHHQAHTDKDSHEDVKGGSPWQEREKSNRDQVSSQTSMKGQAKGFSRGRETGLRMDTKGRHTPYIPGPRYERLLLSWELPTS